jgi:hypothetical protein
MHGVPEKKRLLKGMRNLLNQILRSSEKVQCSKGKGYSNNIINY